MDAHTRMAVSLVLSLLISASNLRMAAMGEADIVDVGVRYVAGFLIVFVLVGIIGRLINGYMAAQAAESSGDGSVDQDADASFAVPLDRHDEVPAELGSLEQ